MKNKHQREYNPDRSRSAKQFWRVAIILPLVALMVGGAIPVAPLQPRTASAATPAYQAREVVRSVDVVHQLNPGQAITVWVDFLNTGTATWYNSGPNFVALNVAEPAGRASVFYHKFWRADYRPAILSQSQVRPGEVGRFRFAIQAPTNVTTGVYLEKFHLVAEHRAWIDGGYFELPIGVGRRYPRPHDYQGHVVERSHGSISVNPGQAFTVWVDYKNTGLRNWHNNGNHFVAMNVTNPVARVSPFQHDFWKQYYRPARLLQPRIYPGETGRFVFALKAPEVEGYYDESFALVAENLTWLPGSETTFRIKVGNPPEAQPVYTIANEPMVRIGLYQATEPVTVTADGSYTVTNANTDTSTAYAANQQAILTVTDGSYWRVTPDDAQSIVTLVNYTHRPSWNSSLNDNTFRGTIEVRHSATTDETWVINELGVESYLRGLAEVSNEQPPEYLKALITAARSYVLWHDARGGKHPDNYYDINATTDQVYRGYGFEQRSVDPLAAITATTGTVITHPSAVTTYNPHGVAVAAYSSGTDGRTRGWTEVWSGGGYPWLVSVTDPHGYIANWATLSGNHMVGLSAQGARGYATEEGKTYDWILQHYYTGVSVTKLF